MSDDAGIADQQDRALARLLELGLAAAEKVQARLMASEDDALLGELSLALNRSSRNVRQTIALQMRAARERRRQDRDETAEAAKAEAAQVTRRRAQVKAAVERVIWTEAEDDEAERLADDLDDRISEEALYDDFAAEPVEVHVARLCAEVGVTPPSAPPADRAAMPAGAEGDVEDGRWRSSA